MDSTKTQLIAAKEKLTELYRENAELRLENLSLKRELDTSDEMHFDECEDLHKIIARSKH